MPVLDSSTVKEPMAPRTAGRTESDSACAASWGSAIPKAARYGQRIRRASEVL